MPTGRLLLGLFVVPGIFALVALGVAPALSSRLPDPMAVHWSAGGEANGTMTLAQNEVFIGVLLATLWGIGAFGVVAGRSTAIRFRTERMAMAWCCGVTAFVAAIAVLVVWVNLDAPSWQQTRFGAWAIVPSLLLGALAGLVGWALAGPKPDAPPLPSGARPPVADGALALTAVTLGPGEHPAWSDHLTSKALATPAVVLAAFAFGTVLFLPWLGIVLLVSAAACAVFASISVVVDGSGLTIRYGPLGWPVQRIPLADITRVEAIELEPLEWGGWGYRMVPGKTAVVLRRGPAIVVTRASNGKQFGVTVDDAATGAALLEAYRTRASLGR